MTTSPMIALIAAVDQQWGLGKDNQLLCHLPKDLKYFKQITLGRAVIMGHNTFLSIGRPLPGRCNIVLTRQRRSPHEGIIYAHDWSQAVAAAEPGQPLMVIGGAMIYRLALSYAQTLYLTHIEHCFAADTFFPSLDWQQWQLVEEQRHPADDKHAYDFRFCRYQLR